VARSSLFSSICKASGNAPHLQNYLLDLNSCFPIANLRYKLDIHVYCAFLLTHGNRIRQYGPTYTYLFKSTLTLLNLSHSHTLTCIKPQLAALAQLLYQFPGPQRLAPDIVPWLGLRASTSRWALIQPYIFLSIFLVFQRLARRAKDDWIASRPFESVAPEVMSLFC